MLRKQRKFDRISNRRNGPNGKEECCSFSVTQGPLGNSHSPRAYCGAPGECLLIFKCDEILFCREVILDLNSEEASSSPKDDGLDEMK
jgi:hypothetical protein